MTDAEKLARLRAAVEPLLAACEADFGCGPGGVCADERDDEPVAIGTDGGSAITFGLIRAARAALT